MVFVHDKRAGFCASFFCPIASTRKKKCSAVQSRWMDKTAVGFLVAVLAITAAGILQVHTMQKRERENLHAGVIRDERLMADKKQQQQQQQQQGAHQA
ncbi:unnamed protein product [Sphagnum jensenii]|uniref:Uncharacterized protein n=1 Tax=Sphagnum jensenii TaxID=128206 RepID=A0ABP0WZR1_9BRYO